MTPLALLTLLAPAGVTLEVPMPVEELLELGDDPPDPPPQLIRSIVRAAALSALMRFSVWRFMTLILVVVCARRNEIPHRENACWIQL
jgi:hypothetical protein